jgi:hypothetical protein
MLKLYNTLTRKKEIFKPHKERTDLPWETHWYQLRSNELLKLKGNLLKELINLGKRKAGSLYKLAELLEMCYVDFWYVLKDQAELVSVKKLKKLASFLKIKYEYFNDKISEIRKGKIISIRNPKFPFNFATKEGAVLLGNIVSDGCIYIDKKAGNVMRTKYSAGTQEELENFVNNINKVFGEVHFQKERQRNSTYLKIGSSIIGEILYKVGAPIGNKSEINPEVPWLIKEGPKEFKKFYLRAIFDDEGSIGTGNGSLFITLSRALHINNYLTSLQKRLLKKIKLHFKERKFPDRYLMRSIEIKKAISLAPPLKNFLLEIKPRLLLEESELLHSLGIKNRIRNSVLNLTKKGNFSILSELRIQGKPNVVKFYRNINFSFTPKKIKLKEILLNKKWI